MTCTGCERREAQIDAQRERLAQTLAMLRARDDALRTRNADLDALESVLTGLLLAVPAGLMVLAIVAVIGRFS